MPQFNHYETKSGRIIDPTFGLDALDAETKRKTKAREQMNTAAMVLRQSLGQRGKGLSEGTVATVSEGGGIEFTGENAAKDESRLYNTGSANYGKSGKGTTTKETQTRDALNVLRNNFYNDKNKADQNTAAMQAVGNSAIGAYNANTLNPTLPSIQQTATGTPTPSGTTAPSPTPIHPMTQTILGGVLPPSLINPSLYVASPAAPTATQTAPTQAAAAQQQGNTNTSVSAGQSKSTSFSTGGGSNSYAGSTQIDSTTDTDIEVRDQLNMNQSDLAVNDAMQALAFHLSGGQSPGTFRNMMDQNNRTMNATNDALAKQGTSQTIRAGIGEQQSSSAPNTSLSMSNSKDQRASTGGGAVQPKTMKKFYNPSGQDIDVESKNGMLDFNGKVNGVSLVMEENILNHSSNPKEFVDTFNRHYSQEQYGKGKYQIRQDPKTKKDEIYIDGNVVGYVTPAKSTGQWVGGKWDYSATGGKSTQMYGLVFTKPVSELDFNQITVQGAR